MEIATLAGGCFWCTEAIYKNIKGIISVNPGYSGGKTENPTYEQVCSGSTGHAEAIQIEFDPKIIDFSKILEVFFALHDPTTLNRQGNDVGTQYRSVVFYHNDKQKVIAESQIISGYVTEVVPYSKFWMAEDYHKNYYESHKDQLYCQAIISPKIKKLFEKFSELIK